MSGHRPADQSGTPMIARMWRGWVRSERIAEYVDIVDRTGMDGYRATPGNLGAQLLTRDLGGGRTELITLSWWSDLDQVQAFAGDDIDTARYYPEDDEFLLDREATVSHFRVNDPGSTADSGTPRFEVSRTLPGTPERIFAFLTRSSDFSRWFVVPGFETPPDRLTLDPRPGGLIDGVLVPVDGGAEVRFHALYHAVDEPASVTLALADPHEMVTLTVAALDATHCRITYRHHGIAETANLADSVIGAEHMLDAMVRAAQE